MLQRLTKYGEKVLKETAERIDAFDDSVKSLARDLTETLYAENGLGLAAPQIGVSKRMFVIDMRKRANADISCDFTIDGKTLPLDIAMPLVAINPEVEEIGEYVTIAEEGCLSFPEIFAEVERSDMVKMRYIDIDGAPHELVCEGLFSRCVQHESDHLDGICFIDRMRSKELFKIDGKLRKLRKQTREFLKSESK